jgi:hypothetical protein
MLQPSSAKRLAIALPIPLAAPVMTAVLFSNNNLIPLILIKS